MAPTLGAIDIPLSSAQSSDARVCLRPDCAPRFVHGLVGQPNVIAPVAHDRHDLEVFAP